MNFSPLEKDKLQILLNDEILLAVLYKSFERASEANRPIVNEDDDNALLGEKYRAFELSKKIIDSAFTLLQAEKVERAEKKSVSRAR